MPLTQQQHLDRNTGCKRILALDGGGIRGVLTLEYLAVIENILKQRRGNSGLVLSDYFDLIGGTSTGAILAACLACGMSVDELKRLYREIGATVFKSSFWRKGILVPKFGSAAVREALDKHLGADTTLGSDRVRTGVMIMTKRLDTGSPWPIHNHPAGAYADQNRQLLLSQVVRASTAAPSYFEPERVSISSREGEIIDGAFVDGGVSPFNDPALQLLMLASLQGHGFRWQTGADNLLLVSLGTGTYRQRFTTDKLMSMPPAEQALRSLASLMDDCARVNHAILQWMTHCQTPWHIDRELKDMKLDSESGPKLATYSRYNVLLEQPWLESETQLNWDAEKLAKMAAMDDATNMDDLADVGRLGATKQVKAEHFPASFDIH